MTQAIKEELKETMMPYDAGNRLLETFDPKPVSDGSLSDFDKWQLHFCRLQSGCFMASGSKFMK